MKHTHAHLKTFCHLIVYLEASWDELHHKSRKRKIISCVLFVNMSLKITFVSYEYSTAVQHFTWVQLNKAPLTEAIIHINFKMYIYLQPLCEHKG